jgi:glycerophosphoryl diester phosphodiesterase
LRDGRSRRARFLLRAALALAALAGVTLGALLLHARPAPDRAFFAGEARALEVIAHRGGARLRPENTLAAFEHAAALGADILEMDARATADGVLVVLHDAAVDRTTDGHGRVDALTLAELKKLDAGYRWSVDGGRSTPFRGKGVRVPTLSEVFAHLPDMRMVVEIKPAQPALAEAACALIRRTRMTRRVLVASMHDAVLDAFRRACPEVATSMGPGEARLFYVASLLRLSAALSPAAQALQIPYAFGERVLATADLLAAARARNLKLQVWTLNDEARMHEALALGVDGIMTDRPDLLLRLIGRRKR